MANPQHRDLDKEQFWRAKLTQQEASDLNVREFCRKPQLSEGNFYSWRREIQKRDQQSQNGSPEVDSSSKTQLIPLRFTAGELESTIEIVLPNRTQLRLTGGVCEASLATVLRVLEQQG